ncbi:hypothetical protein ASG87_03525 [Frateuria sp. Soil773]|uniref:hypothetical protein n=1 Tax=Frateuria sp. Soil773 TaxID=1736407 RepID=UPI0007004C47|nr:hypothetical protein [Frateuria sp. Soil773]KRE89421.1 hypothetical protein ASG87_03525 [Frateuria sp. Soil773]
MRLPLAALPLLGAAALASPVRAATAIPPAAARAYFAEADALCRADGARLWGVSLCGPMMFVDPQSRQVVANRADPGHALKAVDGVFVGRLPADQNVANTAVEWSGVRWTQMLWPLPEEAWKRRTLIAHELFHRIQGQLALPRLQGGDNAQLDTLDGRVALQLEWRALARALAAPDEPARRQAAADALLFRHERYRLYPAAAAQEQALEMNEGLAEYTGVMLGNGTPAERTRAALDDLSGHVGDSTFVRSFAYATGPAYGLLLDRYAPGWRRSLRAGRSFDAMLADALHVTLPAQPGPAVRERAGHYGGAALRAAETAREARRQQAIAGYRRRLVDGPVLVLPFHHMHVQFDPRNLQPLGDDGTVYPTIRISDDWGVLDARNGALMKPDWSALVVTPPPATSGARLAGDGWTLSLKPGWKIVPGTRKGDLVLVPES